MWLAKDYRLPQSSLQMLALFLWISLSSRVLPIISEATATWRWRITSKKLSGEQKVSPLRWCSVTSACVSLSILLFLIQVFIHQLKPTVVHCLQLEKPAWSDSSTQTETAGSNVECHRPFSISGVAVDPNLHVCACRSARWTLWAPYKPLYKSDRRDLFQCSCCLQAILMKTNGPLLASRKAEQKSDDVDKQAIYE